MIWLIILIKKINYHDEFMCVIWYFRGLVNQNFPRYRSLVKRGKKQWTGNSTGGKSRSRHNFVNIGWSTKCCGKWTFVTYLNRKSSSYILAIDRSSFQDTKGVLSENFRLPTCLWCHHCTLSVYRLILCYINLSVFFC